MQVDWVAALDGMPQPHTLVGNLPYLLTGPLLQKAVQASPWISRAVFMVQAEVADRLVAAPGTHAYGALTVFVQAAFAPRRLFKVHAGAFHPRPAVESAVVSLTPLRPPRAVETEAFRQAVRLAFGQRRKMLRNAWRGIFGWSGEQLELASRQAGIALEARGETLAVEDFARFASLAPERPWGEA
jgi:16S rRNA (adenine1518-N6/adenine1519-N6)-dimethyltransferase